MIKSLSSFEKLSSVNLEGTLVTDAAIPTLQRIPLLKLLQVSYTDMSLAAIKAWRTSHPELQILTEKDLKPNAIDSFEFRMPVTQRQALQKQDQLD